MWLYISGALLFLLLVLLAVLFIKVRIFADLENGGFTVFVRAGPVKRQVVPPPFEKEKVPPPPEKKAEKEKPPAEPLETLRLFFDLAEEIKKALGRFADALRIERLDIRIVAAGKDPAEAAVLYGGIAAAVGLLVPALESNFHILDQSIDVTLDFDKPEPEITLHSVLSIRIIRAVSAAMGVGIAYIRQKNKRKKEKAVS